MFELNCLKISYNIFVIFVWSFQLEKLTYKKLEILLKAEDIT